MVRAVTHSATDHEFEATDASDLDDNFECGRAEKNGSMMRMRWHAETLLH
jgi:hypothetical protein